MQLPLSLLRAAVDNPIVRATALGCAGALPGCVFTDKSALCGVSLWAQLLELKNGDTYNGTLVNCDSYMNMNLKGVICTSRVRSASIFGKGCHVTRVVLHADNTAA